MSRLADPEADAAIARRDVLAGVAAIGGLATVPAMARSRWDVIVSRRRAGGVATVAEALALAERAARPFAILIDGGVHEEKLTVRVPGLTLAGSGPDTVLAFGAAAGLARPDGGKWGTSGSAVLTIDAPDVTLQDLTIRNSFDYPDDRRTGASGGAQAVALAIGGRADRTLVRHCGIEGYQDTLLVQSRASFRDCRIAGVVDFIFGGGAALFRHCMLTTRHVPDGTGGGYIAAPSTHRDQPFGFVFDTCRVVRDPGVPDGSTYLGRPWRAGGNVELTCAATYLRCWMDAHVSPDGWTSMGGFEPWDARLFEYGSSGPGAGVAGRSRRMLNAAQARRMTPEAILSGWAG